jgi:glucokinase
MSPPRAIGLDLGGTQVRAALVEDGHVLKRAATGTDVSGGPMKVLDQFERLVREVCAGEDMGRVEAVGISSAGPLDTETGIVIDIPTIPGWNNFPFKAAVTERFGLPVILENDAIAAAFGEWRHGAGRGLRHLVYVTVSTGVGGGAIVDGHLLRGRRGMAAHVGHIRLAQDGPRCACGGVACFEAMASGTALGRRARTLALVDPRGYLGQAAAAGEIAARHVFAGARAGDRACLDLVAEEARYLGQGFIAVIHAFSPELLIMGGGVAQAFDLLEGGIHAVIRTEAVAPFRDIRVVVAELGDNAGLVGAAALAIEQIVSPER